jgi:hypothetical protein
MSPDVVTSLENNTALRLSIRTLWDELLPMIRFVTD